MIPDTSASSLSDFTTPSAAPATSAPSSNRHTYGPCSNWTTFLFSYWFWLFGNKKSKIDRKHLIAILNTPGFHPPDLLLTNFTKLDEALARPLGLCSLVDHACSEDTSGPQWTKATVQVSVPLKGKWSFDVRSTLPNPPHHANNIFSIPDFHYRPLSQLIQHILSTNPAVERFHWHPHQSFWRPDPKTGEEQRIMGELYESNCWLRAQAEVERLPRVGGCNLPRVIAGLMLWSDALALGNFTDAKLWPIYIAFGNQSKYERGQPRFRACYTLGHIPPVSYTTITRCSY